MYWLIIGHLRPSSASAYQTNYLSGYPNLSFKPRQPIPRVQGLTALASGLGYGLKGDAIPTFKKYYTDFEQTPSYAMNVIAAAIQQSIVVNYRLPI
jgi:hypothetical protein